MTTLFDMTGQVALVTGATKGIGQGIAEQLVAHGARVIITSRDARSAEEAAEAINARYERDGAVAHGLAFDIADRNDIAPFAERASAVWGGVDVLVCNASVLSYVGPSAETPEDLFDRLLAVNIQNNFRLCQALRPAIAARGGGTIILIGSLSGHLPAPANLAYGVSKAGVAHLARSLAQEMAPEGIRVNCIAPGLVRSFTSRRIWDDAGRLAVAAHGIPLGRIGEPAEIGGAVVFLASAAGAYVTGVTLHVDGGRSFLQTGSVGHLAGLTND